MNKDYLPLDTNAQKERDINIAKDGILILFACNAAGSKQSPDLVMSYLHEFLPKKEFFIQLPGQEKGSFVENPFRSTRENIFTAVEKLVDEGLLKRIKINETYKAYSITPNGETEAAKLLQDPALIQVLTKSSDPKQRINPTPPGRGRGAA